MYCHTYVQRMELCVHISYTYTRVSHSVRGRCLHSKVQNVSANVCSCLSTLTLLIQTHAASQSPATVERQDYSHHSHHTAPYAVHRYITTVSYSLLQH